MSTVEDAGYYRSRVVIADCAGPPEAFGPVHTERGLRDLLERLEAAGWIVQQHMKLVSVAQFKEHPSVWEGIARQAARSTASSRETGEGQ